MQSKLKKFKYLEQELKTKNESQTSIEESTQSPSTLEETKTPVRKRGTKKYILCKGKKNILSIPLYFNLSNFYLISSSRQAGGEEKVH